MSEGKIIIPNINTRKNAIISRAMTFLSEEDGIGKEIFDELVTLLDTDDKARIEKPDFWYIANKKFGDSLDNSAYTDGCEFVWDEYVVHLKQKEILSDRKIAELEHDKTVLKAENDELLLLRTEWFHEKARLELELNEDEKEILRQGDKIEFLQLQIKQLKEMLTDNTAF